jgi:hypothetical protein
MRALYQGSPEDARGAKSARSLIASDFAGDRCPSNPKRFAAMFPTDVPPQPSCLALTAKLIANEFKQSCKPISLKILPRVWVGTPPGRSQQRPFSIAGLNQNTTDRATKSLTGQGFVHSNHPVPPGLSKYLLHLILS